MKYLLRAIVLLAALGLLVGCGSDKKTSSPATTTTLSNVTTSSTTTTRRNLRDDYTTCLLYTSPSPRDRQKSRMPSSA